MNPTPAGGMLLMLFVSRVLATIIGSGYGGVCAGLLIFSASSSTAASKKATFSRAYSRFDSASNFRAQLLSRSTTEDSESTLADEFDEVDGNV